MDAAYSTWKWARERMSEQIQLISREEGTVFAEYSVKGLIYATVKRK